jgi:hypothetical protein
MNFSGCKPAGKIRPRATCHAGGQALEGRIGDAAPEKALRRQFGAPRAPELHGRVGPPAIRIPPQPIDLRERPLVTVALDFLDALVQDAAVEGMASARGRQRFSAVRYDLRLQEGRLVEQVVAADVIAGHLDGDDVSAGLQPSGQVPFVHAEPAARAARRAVAQELAVDEGAVDAGGGQPQDGAIGFAGGKQRAEAD